MPAAALPEVRPSSGRFGVTASGLGLPAGIPVSGIAGDQQAALFGQACLEPGMTKNTYGTGSFVLMHVGDTCPEPVDGLLTTVGWTLADGTRAYALEGAIFVTGAAVQWLRDGLGIIDERREVATLAATVPDTNGCVLVPAFTGLGSPWWDPYAAGHDRRDHPRHGPRPPRPGCARVDLPADPGRGQAMSAASGHPVRALKADGGAAANDLLLQLQADHLQVPVSRPVIQETTALGAAYLAGLAEGVWGSPADITANWQLDATFEPQLDASAADAQHVLWSRAVRALARLGDRRLTAGRCAQPLRTRKPSLARLARDGPDQPSEGWLNRARARAISWSRVSTMRARAATWRRSRAR